MTGPREQRKVSVTGTAGLQADKVHIVLGTHCVFGVAGGGGESCREMLCGRRRRS